MRCRENGYYHTRTPLKIPGKIGAPTKKKVRKIAVRKSVFWNFLKKHYPGKEKENYKEGIKAYMKLSEKEKRKYSIVLNPDKHILEETNHGESKALAY